MLALGDRPKARLQHEWFCVAVEYRLNKLVSIKPGEPKMSGTQPNKSANQPNVSTNQAQREQVEHKLRWVPLCWELRTLAIYISCCSCQFHLRLGDNANAFCGIWA